MARPSVILQPANGPEAARRYGKTIRKPLRLSSILEFFSDTDRQALAALYPTGWTRAWGVTSGVGGVNRNKWLQFAAGDQVLFCGQGSAFASATLKYRARNRDLSTFLWGADKDGRTWEYIYLIGEPRDQNIPYPKLAGALGFARGFVVLGLTVLNEDQSAAVLDTFHLEDD